MRVFVQFPAFEKMKRRQIKERGELCKYVRIRGIQLKFEIDETKQREGNNPKKHNEKIQKT